MPGGRYIFGSSNSISWATPPENLLAMLRVAKEEGGYGAARQEPPSPRLRGPSPAGAGDGLTLSPGTGERGPEVRTLSPPGRGKG